MANLTPKQPDLKKALFDGGVGDVLMRLLEHANHDIQKQAVGTSVSCMMHIADIRPCRWLQYPTWQPVGVQSHCGPLHSYTAAAHPVVSSGFPEHAQFFASAGAIEGIQRLQRSTKDPQTKQMSVTALTVLRM